MTIIEMLTADNAELSNPNGEVSAYAWPGGYPLFYLTRDCDTLCPSCVNKEIRMQVEQTIEGADCDTVIARDINYEDNCMFCMECSERIEPAYGEDD